LVIKKEKHGNLLRSKPDCIADWRATAMSFTRAGFTANSNPAARARGLAQAYFYRQHY